MTELTGIPTRTVSSVTGIAMPTLRYWVNSELITPSVRGRSGRRRTMLWSVDDIVTLRVFADLRQKGCSLQSIRKAQRLVVDQWQELISSSVLIYQEGDLFQVVDGEQLNSLLQKPGQTVLGLSPVGHWKDEATVVALEQSGDLSGQVADRGRKVS